MNFITKYLATNNLKLVQDYFTNLALTDINKSLLHAEIAELFQRVSNFQDEKQPNPDYLSTLAEILPEILLEIDEELILHKVVPYWQRLRGSIISAKKAIDEFYFELEMLSLWTLLFDSIHGKELAHQRVYRMRSIIRRYSNMPQMWLLLYQQSGEGVSTAYTF